MRLIDADIIVNYQTYDDEYEELQDHKSTIAEFLDTMTDEGCPEAVDAVPVRRGRWIPYNSKYGHDEKVYLCNQCNHNVGFKKMNFCPNCGARMDGKGNGNEGNSIYHH